MFEYLVLVAIFFVFYQGIDWFTRKFFGFGLDSDPLTKEEYDKEQALRLQASTGIVDPPKIKQ